MSTINFWVTGDLADVDETLPGDPRHPSLILVIEDEPEPLCIVVPPSAWRGPRELLMRGRRVHVVGDVGRPGRLRPHTASHVELVDVLH